MRRLLLRGLVRVLADAQLLAMAADRVPQSPSNHRGRGHPARNRMVEHEAEREHRQQHERYRRCVTDCDWKQGQRNAPMRQCRRR